MYVDTEEYPSDWANDYIEECEVNMEELMPGPSYVYKVLRPSNGKHSLKPKNDKFITKTYTFDIRKC